ncbi:MAG: radical SAM protein [SAR324 cluster bacterium]|nr:radical SAM protein [SAR324 cluster bacterium]
MSPNFNKNIICLVSPPFEALGAGKDYVKHIINRSPSIGLLTLAATLRRDSFTPQIVECDILDLDEAAAAKKIIDAKPDFVGFTLFTVGVFPALNIAKEIKKALPEVPIIVGGPHLSSMAKETLEQFDTFDYAIVGEGEVGLSALLEALQTKEPEEEKLAQVPALMYRKQGKVVMSKVANTPMELDTLPMPAWDLLYGFPQIYKPSVFDYPKGPVATFAASRGCPFTCRFCDNSTFGRRSRYHSPDYVLNVMEHLSETYGIAHIQFVDDLFMASKSRVKEICEKLIAKKSKITWSCGSRVDTINPEILELMKAAGCWEISFGLESGSDELLRKMSKSIRIEKSIRAITWAKEAGIRTKGLFMLGYPGENAKTIAETKAFVQKIPLTILNLSKFSPYPGSPIYEDLYQAKLRDEDWGKLNSMNFIWESDEITHEELDREYREILGTFYRRHRVGLYYVKLMIKNPKHVARLAMFIGGWAKATLLGKLKSG